MTIELPLWMQNNTYAARLDRAIIAAIFAEGVLSGFAVSQRGAGPNMSVDVALGSAIIAGDDQSNQGNYYGTSTATENLTGFVAASSTQRIDGVDLRINDPNAGGPAGNSMTIVRTAGSENASPVAPAVPTSAIRLATVGPFTTSTSSITNSMITDVRSFTTVNVGPLGITSGELATDAVITSKIADANVTTAKITGRILGYATDTTDRDNNSTTYGFAGTLSFTPTYVSGRYYEIVVSIVTSSQTNSTGRFCIEIGGTVRAEGRVIGGNIGVPASIRYVSNTLSGALLTRVGIREENGAGGVFGYDGDTAEWRPHLTVRDIT